MPHKSARRRHGPVIEPDLFGGPPRISYRPFDHRKLTAIAVAIWRASKPVRGTAGEQFFLSRRMDPPADASVVRWHPNLTFDGATGPGLIFLMRDLSTGEPSGIVRLRLDEFGWPVRRKLLGRRAGASISHAPPQQRASASRR
jgi:hypothetical protein